ncbi:MAG: ABC transporter substrate-binding protein, partial [Pseudomonadota bacterium]
MSYDLRQACTSLVVATLLLLSGCGPSEDPGTDASSVLRRGNQAEPQTLDPHRSEGTAAGNVLRDLYEGLVTEAADGSIEPGVASAWSVSDDGRTWRFALREGLTWSNGDPLTAADFVAGLRRTVDPQTASAYAPVLAPIAGAGEIIAGSAAVESLGVVAPDSQTLEIRLEQPTPYFLDLLTNPSTYPLHQPSFAEYGRDFV